MSSEVSLPEAQQFKVKIFRT